MSKYEENFKEQRANVTSYIEELDDMDDDVESQKSIAKLEISGSFEFIDEIASGGLKTIHRVLDCKSNRLVALAKLKPEILSLDNVERFIREARILAALEHSNIVPLYDINLSEDNSIYFTMKLLSGDTLASIIEKINQEDPEYINKFSKRVLLDIYLRICDAIIYAHSKGIAHLDIKPENIQVTEYGEVYVMDWGIAKYLNDELDPFYKRDELPDLEHTPNNLTINSTICGTPAYMSPEQADRKNNKPSEASDIFSLGATLYTLVFGQHPFKGKSTVDILNALNNNKIPEIPASRNNQAIPSPIRAIIKKAMDAQPEMRYKSVSALKEDVYLYMNDFATRAEDINLLKFSQLFIKRKKKSISILITFLIAIGISVYFQQQEIEKQKQLSSSNELKVSSIKDEIISGTLQKHEKLREKKQYKQILDNYSQLKDIGHNYTELIFDEAMLYAGESDFIQSLNLLNTISEGSDVFKNEPSFTKALYHIKLAAEGQKLRKLSEEEIVEISLTLDPETQKQIFWNLNSATDKSLEELLRQLETNLCLYNKSFIPCDYLNFKYSVSNNYSRIDLSNNPFLKKGTPLIGISVNEINMSNTGLDIASIMKDFKQRVSAVNISDNKINVTEELFRGGTIKKLIARNTIFSSSTTGKLSHLDIEGAHVSVPEFSSNEHLTHLNIAFTDFKNLEWLEWLWALETLTIDKSMKLSKKTSKALKKRKVKISVKKQR